MSTTALRGLPGRVLHAFRYDPHLRIAQRRWHRWQRRQAEAPSAAAAIDDPQRHVLPFYGADARLPFEPVVAQGPWLVADTGAVVYDVGGYGMLSFGHAPTWCREVLAKPHVMANVMTPSRLQRRFTDALRAHIGQTRLGDNDAAAPGESEASRCDEGTATDDAGAIACAATDPAHTASACPYSHFAFLNSGSEAMELALRLADVRRADDGANDATAATGAPTYVVLENGFHGRTTQAARASDSSRAAYRRHLRSTAHPTQAHVHTVPVNDVPALHAKFNWLAHAGQRVDAMVMEPVMGEGNPGVAVERAFYRAARERTAAAGVPLIVDSVQAGLRATGYLSCVDYPDLRAEAPPEMEVFSKALGAGQYPLSVLACTPDVAARTPTGIYGNTMTGNPKAMEVGYETLRRVDAALVANVQARGAQFKRMLEDVARARPDVVEDVTGTGLLLALHLRPSVDVMEVERRCRLNGLNVIHGGENALRFTPWLGMGEGEVGLVGGVVRDLDVVK
jgi:acetylornithine/succinyldiaminopimelate/putrescine aminotransferase